MTEPTGGMDLSDKGLLERAARHGITRDQRDNIYDDFIALRDAVRAEAFVHQVHAGPIAECSFTYGGPNFRDEDAKKGLCAVAGHWKQCEHCKQQAAAIRVQGERGKR
jgi:hypothetical protein